MRRVLIIAFIALAGLAAAGPSDGWLGMAAMALTTSALILALIVAIGTAFSINELQLIAKEEMFQLIATAVMVVLLFSAESFFNNTFSVLFGEGGETLQLSANNKLYTILWNHINIYEKLKGYSLHLSSESTESFFCSLSGIGFNVAPCNGFGALMTPLSMVMQALALSIAELSSLMRLVAFGDRYAFQLLLPFGLLLRTFKATRGAGGLVIGFAAAMYLFLPLSVLMMDGLTSPGAIPPDAINIEMKDCEVYDFADFGTSMNYHNADAAWAVFKSMYSSVDALLYLFLIQGTMTTVLTLLAFYTSMNYIAKMAGADVDLMSLMRVA